MILVVLDEGSLARTHTDTHAHAPTRTTTHSLFIVGMMLHVRVNQPIQVWGVVCWQHQYEPPRARKDRLLNLAR